MCCKYTVAKRLDIILNNSRDEVYVDKVCFVRFNCKTKAICTECHTCMSRHVAPMLRDLHWEGIDFKLAVLVYRCLHGLATKYLNDHIHR